MTPAARQSFRTGEQWRESLRQIGYFAELETAEKIARWWVSNEPIVFEGGPGTGKTKLAKKIAEAVGVRPYRLQCYDGITPSVALYFFHKRLQELEIERCMKEQMSLPEDLASLVFNQKCMIKGKLAQALDDPGDDIIVIIDEMDKNKDGQLEAALLEYFDENGNITINERNQTLCLPQGKRLHIMVTSNAGLDSSGLKSGGKATLSYPILRRCKFIHFAEPTVDRQAEILQSEVANLSPEMCLQCALFVQKMNKLHEMEKPIALSETICWARSLALLGATELSEINILQTKDDLAKSESDIRRFTGNAKQVLSMVKNAL